MASARWYTSSQVAATLEISLRQLYYWELKGIVRPKTVTVGAREFKRYSQHDVEKLRRIKQYLDEGYTLTAAVRKALAEGSQN
ncbi:MAG: MerR family transcriptional regulator [candidate division KSB1 bacterium]|nr:MerR family transcriptional regulator [candidate division KSB1 bacterium]